MLKSFTRNYQDNSTEEGFQFTFYCDLCHDGHHSSFIESKSNKKGKLFRRLGQGISTIGSLLGRNVGYKLERGSDILSERFQGMSPEWHKEHEQEFERAQNEAQSYFNRCNKCRQWVCDCDFNEEEGFCTECAPRQNVGVAVAMAKKMVADIEVAAESTIVFDGGIESKTIVCPSCGKPPGQGKFCNSCGASLTLKKCPNCGTLLAQIVKFCNECGTKV